MAQASEDRPHHQGKEQHAEPAEKAEPQGIPRIGRTVLWTTGAEILRDECIDDRGQPKKHRDGEEGCDRAVALCCERFGAEFADHPGVDELLEGIRNHRDDGGPRHAHQFSSRRARRAQSQIGGVVSSHKVVSRASGECRLCGSGGGCDIINGYDESCRTC